MTSYTVPNNIHDLQSSRLLRVADVVRITQLSSSQVYSLIQEGVLTAIRFGYALRIRPEDLDEFIKENKTNNFNRFGLRS
jgi:excisionase family DNA binding protein